MRPALGQAVLVSFQLKNITNEKDEKMRNFSVPMTNSAGALAGTVMNANFASLGYPLTLYYAYSIQVVYTGTPTGTLKLQCSDDPLGNYGNTVLLPQNQPVNWTDVTTSPVTISAAGNYVWNCWAIGYNWTRLVYTDSSGGTSTAILTVATLSGKGQ